MATALAQKPRNAGNRAVEERGVLEAAERAVRICANDAESLSEFLECVESLDGKKGEVARALVMEIMGQILGKQYTSWPAFRKSLKDDLYDAVKSTILAASMPPTLPPPGK